MDRVELWPVFGLRVRTPRLTLRAVDPDLAFALAELAAAGIHDPATTPFTSAWTDAEPPELQRNTVRYYFQTMAAVAPASWLLPLAVFDGDELAGVQDLQADDFPVLRQFVTGSWLGRRFQGRGIGREMRAAALHLGFAGLGAERAVTGAYADNTASLGVTRSLGYRPDGDERMLRRGRLARGLRFVLERADWEDQRRDDIEIEGLGPGLRDFLGLGPPA
jgi:RimJ/RimL family protein N-acetyltransferase